MYLCQECYERFFVTEAYMATRTRAIQRQECVVQFAVFQLFCAFYFVFVVCVYVTPQVYMYNVVARDVSYVELTTGIYIYNREHLQNILDTNIFFLIQKEHFLTCVVSFKEVNSGPQYDASSSGIPKVTEVLRRQSIKPL